MTTDALNGIRVADFSRVLAGPYASMMLADLGLNPVVEIHDSSTSTSSRQVANPIGLSRTPPRYRTPPPALGAHPDADWLPHQEEEHP